MAFVVLVEWARVIAIMIAKSDRSHSSEGIWIAEK